MLGLEGTWGAVGGNMVLGGVEGLWPLGGVKLWACGGGGWSNDVTPLGDSI